MVSTILLGMMDKPFHIFEDYIKGNTKELEVINKNAPIFHNLEQALDNYSPDIYLLLMSATKFDHAKQSEIEEEILDTFYKIKSNPRYGNVRLAIQTNSKVSASFLKKLAMLSIWDIFTIEGHAKRINLAKILRQLTHSPNIQNVNQYLENDAVSALAIPNEKQPVKKRQKVVNKPKVAPPSVKSMPRPKKAVGTKIKNILIPSLLLVVLLVGFFSIKSLRFMQSKKNTLPQYSTLISKGEYAKAAKYYPSKAVDAENKMLDDQDVEDKGEVASKIATFNNSDLLHFDNDYFQKNYQDAVEVYKGSDDKGFKDMANSRRIMVAYALMKSGDTKQALEIAKPLDNSELTKRIKIYDQFYKANKILKVKIKNNELNKSELKKAQIELKKNQDAMDRL